MGQWRKNLNSKSRRNSRKPKTLVIETAGSVGINPPGLQPTAELEVGMSMAMVEGARNHLAEHGIKTEFISVEQPK